LAVTAESEISLLVRLDSDRLVIAEGFIVESVETVEIEQRQGRLNAIQPTTNLEILQEPW
jgi:hypothetical protein